MQASQASMLQHQIEIAVEKNCSYSKVHCRISCLVYVCYVCMKSPIA